MTTWITEAWVGGFRGRMASWVRLLSAKMKDEVTTTEWLKDRQQFFFFGVTLIINIVSTPLTYGLLPPHIKFTYTQIYPGKLSGGGAVAFYYKNLYYVSKDLPRFPDIICQGRRSKWELGWIHFTLLQVPKKFGLQYRSPVQLPL